MRKVEDIHQYKTVLPYASEIFGVYQPLLGWRSFRTFRRFERGFDIDRRRMYRTLFANITPNVELAAPTPVAGPADRTLQINSIKLGQVLSSRRENSSFLLDQLRGRVTEAEPNWSAVLTPKLLQETLDAVVKNQLSAAATAALRTQVPNVQHLNALILDQAVKESQMAAYLQQLVSNNDTTALKAVFATTSDVWKKIVPLLRFRDPFEYLDPENDLGRVIVSPISIVHLFRQYFFEFDTFLGTPVAHVWLSPGSQVELVEVSTRKTITERTFESELERTTKFEKETQALDEISTAVRDENESNTKFGFTTTVNQGWVGGSATASASMDLNQTQKQAREVTHKQMRQQTERLSAEIRSNYKSTFRTVSETTDTSSKRYLLNNTTSALINYELRRKMRQVGVQIQDIGTYLCWQTYVDDPGRQLGVAKLVHVAEPPEVGSTPPPESTPLPVNHTTETAISINFEPRTDDTNADDMNETYKNGVETDTDTNEGTPEKIRYKFHGFTAAANEPGFRFDSITFADNGNDIRLKAYDIKEAVEGKITFSVKVVHVNFRGTSPLQVTAKVTWTPTDDHLNKIDTENAKKVSEFNAETQQKFKEAYMKAVRERIKLASQVEARTFDELREEERIVVYRALIQDMLTKGLPITDDRTRHAVAELLNSIFDIDKMLYFVAPEWWRPRLHHSRLQLGGVEETAPAPDTASAGSVYALNTAKKPGFSKVDLTPFLPLSPEPVPEHSVVGWGGTREAGRDNYYITEESERARMGSSLGWLLQLDGDNLRNAFLNAPWVKAVVPIRPGRERAAFNWLQRVGVEGSEPRQRIRRTGVGARGHSTLRAQGHHPRCDLPSLRRGQEEA